MKIRTHNRAGGFSLVEILLTLVLFLALAAATVFTFTAIYQTANLDEGYDRFQSLIRFAQAEAATTGRKVRLEFVPVETEEIGSELREIRVLWESDFLNAPGVFETYTNKAWSEDIVNELVTFEQVKPLEGPMLAGTVATPAGDTGVGETAEALFETQANPSITFYPDGSCDSAEVVVASRNTEDDRRLAVRLSGILGSVSSRPISSESSDLGTDEPIEDLNAGGDYPLEPAAAQEAFHEEFQDLFEEARPTALTDSGQVAP